MKHRDINKTMLSLIMFPNEQLVPQGCLPSFINLNNLRVILSVRRESRVMHVAINKETSRSRILEVLTYLTYLTCDAVENYSNNDNNYSTYSTYTTYYY